MNRLLALLLCVTSFALYGQGSPAPTDNGFQWIGTCSSGVVATQQLGLDAVCACGGSVVTPATVGSTTACTSALCGGATFNLGTSSVTAYCDYGGGTILASIGQVYLKPQCPASHNRSADGTACVSSLCQASIGKEVDFEVTWLGSAGDANPAYGCYAGCKAYFQSASRFDITVATGERYNAFKGVAALRDEYCGPGDKNGGVLSSFRAVGVPGLTGSATGTGGVGSDRGASAGFQTGDGLNLAKVATNTARIADALAGGTGGTGGESTVGGGATCGGPSQPSCNVTLDAGDSAAQITAGAAAASTALSTMASGLDAVVTQYTTPPDMKSGGLPDAGRWEISFGPFLTWSGTDDCEVYAEAHLGASTLSPGVKWCDWLPQIRAFLYWAMALYTAFALWNLLYGPSMREA